MNLLCEYGIKNLRCIELMIICYFNCDFKFGRFFYMGLSYSFNNKIIFF